MISIVIPTHDEDVDVIRPLMQSINDQVGIDFKNDIEILICSDVEHGSFDEYDFSEYKFIKNRIRKIKSPMRNNIGINRQTGIDNALGDYVCFCDIDDSFNNYVALRALKDNIAKSEADVYSMNFIEETMGDQYLLHRFNWIWVFSKAYRVKFLKDNGIRFDPTLQYHEDTYFNFLVRHCDPKTVDIDDQPYYLWRAREDSITRKQQHDYTFSSWDQFIDATSKAIKYVSDVFDKDCRADVLSLAVNTFDTLHNKRSKLYKETKTYETVEIAYYRFLKEFIPIVFTDQPAPNLIDQTTELFYRNKHDFFPEYSWYQHCKILQKKYGKFVDI